MRAQARSARRPASQDKTEGRKRRGGRCDEIRTEREAVSTALLRINCERTSFFFSDKPICPAVPVRLLAFSVFCRASLRYVLAPRWTLVPIPDLSLCGLLGSFSFGRLAADSELLELEATLDLP